MRNSYIFIAALLACGAASAQKTHCADASGKSNSADCRAAGSKSGKASSASRSQADPLGIRAPGQSSLYDLNPGGGLAGPGPSSLHSSGAGASMGLRSPGSGMQPPKNR